MPAPLASLLDAVTSGAGVLSPELIKLFGGADSLLSALKTFDPNAKITETEQYGGEGGPGPMGYRLDYDVSKAPKSQGGTLGLDLRPSGFGKLKDPTAVYDDDNYGSVTNSANVYKPTDPLWTKLAPLAVSVFAPMAGAALAGAGIGGTAGLTAAATGSGLGGASNLPGWAAQALTKAPQTAGQIANGNFNPLSLVSTAAGAAGLDPNMTRLLGAIASGFSGGQFNPLSLLPALGGFAGINPNITSAGTTLAQLARQKKG